METNGMKMLTMGDSITNGFNGKVILHKNYPFFLKQFLQLKELDNVGKNGGMLSGISERDLAYQVKITDFHEYDLVSIAYGTNDYDFSDLTLNEIKHVLSNQIRIIKNRNPNIIIIGILPINRFQNGNLIDKQPNSMGYDFRELNLALESVYQTFQIPVLNLRKVAPNFLTLENYQFKLNDCSLHPNEETYREIAQIIATFIKEI